MRLSREEAWRAWECDSRKNRRNLLIIILIALVFVLFVLSWGYDQDQYNLGFTPLLNLKSIFWWFKRSIIRIFDSSYTGEGSSLVNYLNENVRLYSAALDRLKLTFMTFVSGAGLAIAGGVFQSAYRNPMASPNMLGVTAGVNMGNILMVLIYGTAASATQFLFVRYEYCYGLTAICVVLVLVLGRLAGDKKKNISIIEMIMIGSIISQLINTFVTYFMYNMDDELLVIYEEIALGAVMHVDDESFLLFAAFMVVSIIPMLLFKYRMNVISMEYDETKTLGLRAGVWRTIAQICAVIMTTAAMIHCGQVGMISMVVPYIVRNAVGSDFRKLTVYSALIGGTVVMLCQFLATFIHIDGTVLPATTIINVFTTPAFMVIMARQRRKMDAA